MKSISLSKWNMTKIRFTVQLSFMPKSEAKSRGTKILRNVSKTILIIRIEWSAYKKNKYNNNNQQWQPCLQLSCVKPAALFWRWPSLTKMYSMFTYGQIMILKKYLKIIHVVYVYVIFVRFNAAPTYHLVVVNSQLTI